MKTIRCMCSNGFECYSGHKHRTLEEKSTRNQSTSIGQLKSNKNRRNSE